MHYIFGERYLYTSANVGSASITAQEMKFSFNPQFPADLLTLTKEIRYRETLFFVL